MLVSDLKTVQEPLRIQGCNMRQDVLGISSIHFPLSRVWSWCKVVNSTQTWLKPTAQHQVFVSTVSGGKSLYKVFLLLNHTSVYEWTLQITSIMDISSIKMKLSFVGSKERNKKIYKKQIHCTFKFPPIWGTWNEITEPTYCFEVMSFDMII